MTGDARWVAIFDRLALVLTITAFLLREWLSSSTAGFGLNLFIHLLFWIALALWFAGRASSGGGPYRFTALEFGFLGFSVFALISVLRASFKLPAIDQAFAWLSLGLFFVLCVQVLGKRLLTSMLLASLVALSVYAFIQDFVLFPLIDSSAKTSESVEMARRIHTHEAFASFIGPNQLAAFLVLLIPLLAGSMIDGRDYKLRGPALILAIGALVLTGSLGGWVSLAAGAIAMTALALTRTRGRALVVGIGAAVVGIAIALLLTTPLMPALAKRSHSLHVRAVYWRATGPIIASAPLLGVGLDNWQEHYFQKKSDVQQETRKAHNDYLQILAETGVPGLLAFLALLGLGLRKALAREAAPEADPEPPSAWLIGSAVGVPVLLGLLTSADVIQTSVVIVSAAVWVGFLLLQRKQSPAPAEEPWTRIGAAGGLVAFLVHMTADFLVYETGIAAAFVAVLALVAMQRGKSTEVKLPKTVCAGATGVLILVTLPLILFVVPRTLAADGEVDQARAALAYLESGSSSNPTQPISDAIRLSESAQAHNPFNPESYQLLARAKFHEWDLLQKMGSREPKLLESAEGTALQALDNAIALRPLSSPLHFEKSQLHRLFRRPVQKAGRDSELARAKAAEHLRLALEEQRRAWELYPTYARNAYLLARLLDSTRDPEATKHFQEALRLSDLAGKELEDLDRLKLDALARARALRAIGKPLDAHDVLDAYLRKSIQGLPAAEARARLERFVKRSDEEMDEGMAPVLKDVYDAILRDLK